jgi:hypothetical protein
MAKGRQIFEKGIIFAFPFDQHHYGCMVLCNVVKKRSFRYDFILTDYYSIHKPDLIEIDQYSCYGHAIITPDFDKAGFQKFAEHFQSVGIERMKLQRLYAAMKGGYEFGLRVVMVEQKHMMDLKDQLLVGKASVAEEYLNLYGGGSFGETIQHVRNRMIESNKEVKEGFMLKVELKNLLTNISQI